MIQGYHVLMVESGEDLFEASPIPTWVYDAKTLAMLAVNRAACRELGYSRAEMFAKTITDLRPSAAAPRFHEQLARGRGADLRVERLAVYLRKDGSIFEATTSRARVRFLGRGAILCAALGIGGSMGRPRASHDAGEEFRETVETVLHYAVFLTARDGSVASWNAGARRLFGYRKSEIVGRPVGLLFTAADRRRGVPAQGFRQAQRRGRYTRTLQMRRKDGRRFFVESSLTFLREKAGRPTGFLEIIRERGPGQSAAPAGESSQAQRRRLARELHDGVNQFLAAALLRLRLAMGGEGRMGAATLGALRESARIIEEAIAEVRRISYHLQPAALAGRGLARAVRGLARSVPREGRLAVSVETRGMPSIISQAVELAAYRIIQEALANVVAHAAARKAAISLRASKGALTIEVRDDGRGFRPPLRAAMAGGAGLENMRERASSVSGSFDARSSPGNGTMIRAVLPLRSGGRES